MMTLVISGLTVVLRLVIVVDENEIF